MRRHHFSVGLCVVLGGCCLTGSGPGEDPGPQPTAPATPTAPEGPAVPEAPAAPGGATLTPAAAEVLESATFCKRLGEHREAIEPTQEFLPDEAVAFVLTLKGRPRSGGAHVRFMYRDRLLAETTVDVSEANAGVFFSVGSVTNVGVSFTHPEPLWVGHMYRAEASFADRPLGTWPFRVVPPPGAVASSVSRVVLAKGMEGDYQPVEETTTFAPTDTIHLVGRGTFGLQTWIQVEWTVSDALDAEGTRSLTMQENATDIGFAFNFRPASGWPVGSHRVVLTMNDDEVGSYAFTVTGG